MGVGLSVGPVPAGKHPFLEARQGMHCGNGGMTQGMRVGPPSSPDVVVEGAGRKVNVSPSVVSVVGAVRPVGIVMVSEPPMMRTPELEITV